MRTMECKVLQQLHNISSRLLHKNFLQMTTVLLLTKVPLGWASSGQSCPSQHCQAYEAGVPPPTPDTRHGGPRVDGRSGTGRGHRVITWNKEGCERGGGSSSVMPSSCSSRLSLSWSSLPCLCFPDVSAFSSAPGHVLQSSWPVSRTAVRWRWKEVWEPVWQWWGSHRGLWQPIPPHTLPMPERQSSWRATTRNRSEKGCQERKELMTRAVCRKETHWPDLELLPIMTSCVSARGCYG